MANVRAFRSGRWSDTNTTTSPWASGEQIFAPAANDDVYSNNFTIHVDTNVTVNSVANATTTSVLWKDGATAPATAGGTFNLLNGVIITGNVLPRTSNSACITLSGSNAATVVGNVSPSVNAGGGSVGIIHSSSNRLDVVGTIRGGTVGGTNRGINVTSSGILVATGENCGFQGEKHIFHSRAQVFSR